MLFTQSSNAAYLLVETDCGFPTPLTFPLMGVQFRHTLRVSREIALTVPDNQRQLGECILFPAPPLGWACSSFQCLTQPLVYCTSAALKPFLERPFRESSHSFLQLLAVSVNTFTFQKRKNNRRAFIDHRPALFDLKSSITFLLSVSPP